MKNQNQRIKIESHPDRVNSEIGVYRKYESLANKLITSFKAIGIGEVKSFSELKNAVNAPNDFLQDKIGDRIGDEVLKVGGIIIKKQALAEMADINNTAPFFTAASAFNTNVLLHGVDTSFFDFNEGVVSLREDEARVAIEEKHTAFIASNIGIELHDDLKNIVDSINAFNEKLKSDELKKYDVIPLTLGTIEHYYFSDGHRIPGGNNIPMIVRKEMLYKLATIKDAHQPK